MLREANNSADCTNKTSIKFRFRAQPIVMCSKDNIWWTSLFADGNSVALVRKHLSAEQDINTREVAVIGEQRKSALFGAYGSSRRRDEVLRSGHLTSARPSSFHNIAHCQQPREAARHFSSKEEAFLMGVLRVISIMMMTVILGVVD